MSTNFPTARAPRGTDLHCPICLSYASQDTSQPFIETPCHHYFHRDCMITWETLKTNDSCPECQQRIFQAAQVVLQVNDDQAEARVYPTIFSDRQLTQRVTDITTIGVCCITAVIMTVILTLALTLEIT
jgi:hypothetical protein